MSPSWSLAGAEVKRLKKRVSALESITGTTSARSSRLSSSPGLNILDPLESSYIDRSSAGNTLVRSENGINLGSAGQGGGSSWNQPRQDNAALQRAIRQLLMAELHSDAVKGKTWTDTPHPHSTPHYCEYDWPQLLYPHRYTLLLSERRKRVSGTKRHVSFTFSSPSPANVGTSCVLVMSLIKMTSFSGDSGPLGQKGEGMCALIHPDLTLCKDKCP